MSFTYDHFCLKCKIIKKDVEADGQRLTCPGCSELMNFRGYPPAVNFKSSDLPSGNWDIEQPAFGGKHFNSKKEVMAALKEFNIKEKEKADIAGQRFNEYQWLPEPTQKDREYQEMAKEMGPDSVNDLLKHKHEEALDKDLDQRLNSKWTELAEGCGL